MRLSHLNGAADPPVCELVGRVGPVQVSNAYLAQALNENSQKRHLGDSPWDAQLSV